MREGVAVREGVAAGDAEKRRSPIRRVPWIKVWAAAIWLNTVGREYWDRLTSKERRELLDLMVKSKGSRSNLTNNEQGRLFDLFNKIRRGGE